MHLLSFILIIFTNYIWQCSLVACYSRGLNVLLYDTSVLHLFQPSVWVLRHYNTLKVHMEWKNALVKSRKLQALKIIQKSVTLELNLLVIRTCFSAIFLPIEDNLNVDFENGILVDDAQSQMAGISEHITPKNPWLQHCRAEVTTLHHQTHQKGSTRTQTEHAVLVSQLKPAAHVTNQQTSFWKAECERQCKEDFLIQVPLWVANQATFTSHWPFFSYYSYKSILFPLTPTSFQTCFPANIHYYG